MEQSEEIILPRREVKFKEIKDEDLEKDYIGGLRQDLLDGADKLKSKLAEKTAVVIRIGSIENTIGKIKHKFLLDINEATNLEGKKLFTNEATRNAELSNRLSCDQEFIMMTDELNQKNFKLQEINNDIEVLTFDVKNKRCILDSMPRYVHNL